MNKYLLGLFVFFCFNFFSCNQEKISPSETLITILKQENIFLNNELKKLREENQKLKETDMFYYQSGVDEFGKKNYVKTIEWMNKLKSKYPASSLITSADKLIRDSNTQISAIYEREKTTLNQLLREARNLEIEDAISKLEDYVKSSYHEDLVQLATNSLNTYKTEYEKVRSEREWERSIGIRLVDYATGWGFVDDVATQLFVPQIRLVFKNISDFGLRDIEVKAEFIKTTGNEVFGNGNDYLVYEYSGMSLEPGYSKTVYVYSNIGYRNKLSYATVPDLFVNIYIKRGSVTYLYRKIPIAKKDRA